MATDLLSPSPRLKPITAATIKSAMAKTWAAPEYAVLWEVPDATGARGTRSADALIMSLWPSRGLELHGVEIKVARGDWKREAANPKKAETIAAYCDRWWVHTGPDVIHDLAEVPLNWGWREHDGTRWKTRREAVKINPKPCDRAFLAALLRRSDEAMQNLAAHQAAKAVEVERESICEEIERQVKSRTNEADRLSAIVDGFEKASGLRMSRYGDLEEGAEIGALVKAIRETGLQGRYGALSNVLWSLQKAAEQIESALKKAGFPKVGADA